MHIPNKISGFLGIIADVNLYTENGKDYIEIAVSDFRNDSFDIFKEQAFCFSTIIRNDGYLVLI